MNRRQFLTAILTIGAAYPLRHFVAFGAQPVASEAVRGKVHGRVLFCLPAKIPSCRYTLYFPIVAHDN
jgi:hypothetical protein